MWREVFLSENPDHLPADTLAILQMSITEEGDEEIKGLGPENPKKLGSTREMGTVRDKTQQRLRPGFTGR